MIKSCNVLIRSSEAGIARVASKAESYIVGPHKLPQRNSGETEGRTFKEDRKQP